MKSRVLEFMVQTRTGCFAEMSDRFYRVAQKLEQFVYAIPEGRISSSTRSQTDIHITFKLAEGFVVALATALTRQVVQMQAFPSVRLSVRFHSNFWTEWPLTLTFRGCIGHDHGSHGTEGQGQRSTLGLVSQFETRSERPRSSIQDVFSCYLLGRPLNEVAGGLMFFTLNGYIYLMD